MARDILLVGCGNMGFAMLTGWMAASPGTPFYVVEPNSELRERARSIGAHCVANVDELSDDLQPQLVFLAVKPQIMDQVVPEYARFEGASFVSIAAGVTTQSIEAWLGQASAIIRTMPNTPAAIGEGMMVSFANERVSDEARNATENLLACSGKTGWIDDENLMDAVTAISGSGPAYVFHFIECLEQSAIELGLPADLSRVLALQTVAGAGKLAQTSDVAPGVLREQVTSKGGTTAAALDVLRQGLQPLTNEATKAARDRGIELGKS